MALWFPGIICALTALNPQTQEPSSILYQGLEVKSPSLKIEETVPFGSKVTYSGGVSVTYGVTTILADIVTIDRVAKHAVAKGHVHLTDPDATIDAQELEFTWQETKESGHIEELTGRFEGLSVKSDSVDITPKGVQLLNADLRPANSIPSLYRISAKRITLITGKYIRFERPNFKFLGVDLPWHRTTTVSLDPRVHGVGVPSFAYRSGSLGVNYTPNFLVTPQTAFQAWGNLFSGSLPHYGILLAHTFLSPSVQDQGKIVPESDLSARFGYGYFDNVMVLSPEAEFESVRLHRNSVEVDSEVNEGSDDRLPGGSITKAAEIAYENGGPLGTVGQISHVRLQSVRQQDQTAFTTRMVFDTSIGVHPIKLLPNLESVIRFDTQGFAGYRLFGWARGQFGLAANPVKPLTLSAAYVTASETGTPDLTTDHLYNYGAWCFRGDLYLGSIRGSYLTRFYLNGQMFDDEYEISQVVGNFRVSVMYRRFPSDFRIGATFRLDDMIAAVKRHHEIPSAPAPAVPLVPPAK